MRPKEGGENLEKPNHMYFLLAAIGFLLKKLRQMLFIRVESCAEVNLSLS